MDHPITWGPVRGPHYNTSLEEILASMGENGEREIEWDFHRGRKQTHNIQSRELGTKDTPGGRVDNGLHRRFWPRL